ncbi:MAG TPA: aconitase X catalytic domain-containing protein [Anaerolineales bacterium]|nr:aconitase X catalytic domain-containing protein [Anaerolineales bacterium]
MQLIPEEQEMLAGEQGRATQKAMQILVALGKIYGAVCMIPINSVQVAGVSYDNLGEAGLQFLAELADGGGKVRVPTTLNPAGMDIENWQTLGIPPNFAQKQLEVLEAFSRMGVTTTCTCTPYLVGNLPAFGEHLAWSESSAVCYANSVLGARTNREGGPSALAAALTGRTPEYGLHLAENRTPEIAFQVDTRLSGTSDFGALGKLIGEKIESNKGVPAIEGVPSATLEELKSLCASLATYGGAALFHMRGITPEADQFPGLSGSIRVTRAELDAAIESLTNATGMEVDFVSLGCPHLSLPEIARLASLLDGQQVRKEFWITTARQTKQMADRLGYTRRIEASGARFAADTCCVVAPIQGRFTAMATDSAKACYYANAKNKFKTKFLSFDEVVRLALQ